MQNKRRSRLNYDKAFNNVVVSRRKRGKRHMIEALTRRKLWGAALLLSCFFVMFTPSHALSFELRPVPKIGYCLFGEQRFDIIAIAVIGEIADGMAAELENKIQEVQNLIPMWNERDNKNYKLCQVDFQSPGGDVFEAMKIGRMIRRNGLETWTGFSTSYCYSACVLAFSGGIFRFAFENDIGIHSFYSPSFIGTQDYENSEVFFDKVYTEVENFLREMRVPRAILDQMVSISFQHLRHLTTQSLIDIGFLGFDPVYDQVTPRAP